MSNVNKVYIGSKFRMRIAKFMDKRFKSACWAELVSWATWPKGHPFWEIFGFGEGKYKIWQQTCDDESGAYCGKCFRTGRIKKSEW